MTASRSNGMRRITSRAGMFHGLLSNSATEAARDAADRDATSHGKALFQGGMW